MKGLMTKTVDDEYTPCDWRVSPYIVADDNKNPLVMLVDEGLVTYATEYDMLPDGTLDVHKTLPESEHQQTELQFITTIELADHIKDA